jgi:hypothetical protein
MIKKMGECEAINPKRGVRWNKYNLQSRARHVPVRTNLVQTGRRAALTRIDGRFSGDFHNVFHRICEDPGTRRW